MSIFRRARKKLGLSRLAKQNPTHGDNKNLEDLSKFENSVINAIESYTMTSIERQVYLCRIIEYVINNCIEGDFVECGVWKGGSAMIAGFYFQHHKETRDLWLYDNFTGMPPTNDERDKDIYGQMASVAHREHMLADNLAWCQASMDEVKNNMLKTKIDPKRVNIIPGDVLSTIPDQGAPSKISVLRLDTDWYSSTIHELRHLYPLVSHGGFIMVDDYGHWQGAKTAVDEYLNEINYSPFLHRVDYTCRVFQKLEIPDKNIY